MLKSVVRKKYHTDGGRFAIVASKYNARYVDSMVRAAQAELKRAGADEVRVVRVPGAYEVPLAAAQLARHASAWDGTCSETEDLPFPETVLAAVICLGVILRGETVHAAHIGEAVSRALMEIQLRYGVPVIHEVLLLESHEQARARCLDRRHNRGTEAAQTALAMAQLMSELRGWQR